MALGAYRELVDALEDAGSGITLRRLLTTNLRHHWAKSIAISSLDDDAAMDLLYTRYGPIMAAILNMKAAELIRDTLLQIQRENMAFTAQRIQR